VGAARYLLSTWRRERVAALLGVAVLAAASFGVVVLASLGAVRAGTAWEDLRARGRGEDLLIDVPSIDVARQLATAAAQVDGVASVAPLAYSYLVPEGRREDFFGGVILPLGPRALDALWRPVLIAGRAAAQDTSDEVVVNQDFVDVTGLDVGGKFVLVDPLGLISQAMTISGIGVLPVDFTFGAAAPLAYPTTTFTRKWESRLLELEATAGPEVLGSSVAVASASGVSVDELAARLTDRLPSAQVKSVNTASSTAALVVDTVDLQRNGYAVLALASGLAALSMIALLFAGVTRLPPAETLALRAVGFGRRELALAICLPGLFVILIGTIGAIGAAVLFEGLVPTGLAERIGAGRQLGDDVGFLALSAVCVATILGALVAAVAQRSTRVARADPPSRRRAQALLRWPALALGLRYATGGLTRAGRRQAAAALLFVAVATTGISAVAVIVQSRDELLADPSRIGKFFDVYLYTYTDSADAQTDRQTLAHSSAVAGVAMINIFTVSVDGQGAAAISVEAAGNGLASPVVQGRLANAANEMVVSVPFLRRLHRHVGDTVEVSGPAGHHEVRVVGAVVLPFVAAVAAGEQVAMTASGQDAVGAEPEGYVLGADLRDPIAARSFRAGNDRLDACETAPLLELLGVDRLVGPASGAVSLCVPRGDQRAASLNELGAVPRFIVGFLIVLGIAGLAFLLRTSIRGARRDLAVLRAIGFTRRQTTTTVLVHAATVGLLGSLAALPFGLALGRWAWRGLAEAIGVAVRPEVSIMGTLGVVLAALVVAELVAAPFAMRLVSRPAAEQLQAE
jgi:ABC-type antimicrobial peptide transport system permease subunit